MKKLFLLLLLPVAMAGCRADRANQSSMEDLRLKDFDPVSIFNIQKTYVEKAKFPVIDSHSHDYAANKEEVAEWVRTMDAVGVEVTHLLSCSWIGQPVDQMFEKYADHADRFRFWCSFDYTGFGEPDWEERAIASLEYYHSKGAVGVGEMGDKGLGDLYGYPTPGEGVHIDDPRLQPLLARCGELGMPINIHIADPIWMYEPMDEHNDGLMNAYTWRIDTLAQGGLGFNGLIDSFERAVAANPGTTFIACHYLNMTHDYPRLGAMLDKYPNMYVDLAARHAESAVIPRATRKFIEKYPDRILFGTDNGMEASMYRSHFRLLETDDEHIYESRGSYHWALHGLDLPDDVLRKIYRENAIALFHK